MICSNPNDFIYKGYVFFCDNFYFYLCVFYFLSFDTGEFDYITHYCDIQYFICLFHKTEEEEQIDKEERKNFGLVYCIVVDLCRLHCLYNLLSVSCLLLMV